MQKLLWTITLTILVASVVAGQEPKHYPAELARVFRDRHAEGELEFDDSPAHMLPSIFFSAAGEPMIVDPVGKVINHYSLDFVYKGRIEAADPSIFWLSDKFVMLEDGRILGTSARRLVLLGVRGEETLKRDLPVSQEVIGVHHQHVILRDAVSRRFCILDSDDKELGEAQTSNFLRAMAEDNGYFASGKYHDGLNRVQSSAVIDGYRILGLAHEVFHSFEQYMDVVDAGFYSDLAELRYDRKGGILLGYDGEDNSYWWLDWYKERDRPTVYVFNRFGKVVACFRTDIYLSGISVSPSGDLYQIMSNRRERSYEVYVIRNVWSTGTLRRESSLISTLSATSTLYEPSDGNAYHPVKLFDGDTKTMWIEDAKGPGIGESITVGFDAPVTTDEIQFMPGAFWKEYWKQNYRVKSLEVKLDDKVFTASFKDEMTVQSLKLSSRVTFKTAVFTIKDVYPSTKWEDTAISEIAFFNQGAKVEVDYSKFKEFLRKAL